MIVTEKEAKTKRCQETLAPVGTSDHVWHDSSACIGSACMAWRSYGYRVRHEGKVGPILRGEPGNLIEGRTAERVGYCGKAGKP